MLTAPARRPVRSAPLTAAALLAAAGCTAPRTEIVVRVATDMPQGPRASLTGIEVDVTFGDGATPDYHRMYTLGEVDPPLFLPADLGLGPPDPRVASEVRVAVTALGVGAPLFTRTAAARFAPGQTRLLEIFLASRCTDAANGDSCGAGQSCGATGCEAERTEVLPEFVPLPPDAGCSPPCSGDDAGLGANLVVNPSFEHDYAGWKAVHATLDRVQIADAPDGQWAARAASDGMTAIYSIDDSANTVGAYAPGRRYVLRAFVRAASSGMVGRPAYLNVRIVPDAGASTVASTRGLTLSTVFQPLLLELTTPAAPGHLVVYASQAEAQPGDAFLLDQVSVQLAPP